MIAASYETKLLLQDDARPAHATKRTNQSTARWQHL